MRGSAVDIFAGVGGMSLGIEAAGFDVLASVEVDPIHACMHEFNFPYGKTICNDLSKVESEQIIRTLENKGVVDLDLLVGGPPCQGFSQIGKRQLDDPRNQLVFEFLRVVNDLRPKYFIFENVPGIVSGKHKVFIEELIGEFEKIGYSINTPYKILNAADFNVAQARKRFILLGSRYDIPKLLYPKATNKVATEQMAIFSENDMPVVGAYQAIGNLQDFDVYIGDDLGIDVDSLRYGGYDKGLSYDKSNLYSFCHQRNFESRKIWGHIGSKHTQKSIERFAYTGQGDTEKVSRFFKLSPDFPCNTLRAGTPSGKGAFTAPRPIHYQSPRCISIREAARLHSYPDWFQFHRTIWHGFRQIGNSVAPLFAKSLGEEVFKLLNLDKDKLSTYDLPKQNETLAKMNTSEAAALFGVDRSTIPARKRLNNKEKERA